MNPSVPGATSGADHPLIRKLIEDGPDALSIQELIDTGLGWHLAGRKGRACANAIKSGEAMLGPEPVRDSYGNLVPAWWMVKPGKPGSPEFAGRERPPHQREPTEPR